MISVVIYFLSATLRLIDLNIGMALGMFGIFAILRYRTVMIPIKEMTFMFILIGINLINGLSDQSVSTVHVICSNVIIVLLAYLVERFYLNSITKTKTVIYEKIENITPENKNQLLSDLSKRTGHRVTDAEVGDIDFLRDIATLRIYYKG